MQWRHDRWACTCSQVGSRLIDSMKCSQNPPAFIRRERVPFSCADAAFDYRRFDLRRAKNSLCRLMHSDSAVSSLALSVNINWSASFRLDWPSEIKATHCYPNTISSSEGCTSVDLLLRGKCFDLPHAIAVFVIDSVAGGNELRSAGRSDCIRSFGIQRHFIGVWWFIESHRRRDYFYWFWILLCLDKL